MFVYFPNNVIVINQQFFSFYFVLQAGLAAALSQLRLGEERNPEQEAYENLMRRQSWETGQIDYMGRDSFENIWKKITQTLEAKPASDDNTGSS